MKLSGIPSAISLLVGMIFLPSDGKATCMRLFERSYKCPENCQDLDMSSCNTLATCTLNLGDNLNTSYPNCNQCDVKITCTD